MVSESRRLYCISTKDRKFIDSLEGMPVGTDKVYAVYYTLRSPPDADKVQVARQLATATTRDIVDKLGLTQHQQFTHDKSKAKRGNYREMETMYEFMIRFQLPLPDNLAIEEF